MESGPGVHPPPAVIATDIPTTLRRPDVYRGVLHETRDQAAMFGPVTRAARTLERAEEIVEAVSWAAERALSAPSGPVYLGIPTNLLSTVVELPPPELGRITASVTPSVPARPLLPLPSASAHP